MLLHATTFEVGLLTAASTISFLLIALPAGVVVDRTARRRLMLGCDVARTLIIGSVPVAWALGHLTMAQLFAVAFLSGLLTVFFDVAYQSYLPSLVRAGQLIDGNGKLGATQSFAQVVGPGLGGALFGAFKATAFTVDAVSYAVSALSLALIRTREKPPDRGTPATGERPRLRHEAVAGLLFVVRHPILRKIAACTGTANLFGAMTSALAVIFLVRVLRVPPGYTGLLFGGASVAGVLAGVVSGRLARLIGSARIIWFSLLVFGSPQLLLPLAQRGWPLAFFVIGDAATIFAAVLYNIAQVSYRQSVCPPGLLGRMNAAIRWIVWGTLPLGGVIGGTLGSTIGVRPTLWIGVIGSWAAGFLVLLSPLRRLRDIPSTEAGAAGQADPGEQAASGERPEAEGRVAGRPATRLAPGRHRGGRRRGGRVRRGAAGRRRPRAGWR